MALSTWISSPSVKTMCTLSQLSRRTSRSVRLLDGDAPVCLRSTVEISNRASPLRCARLQHHRHYDRASMEFPISAGVHVLHREPRAESLQALILKSHFSICHNSTCFTLAASVVTVRGFPHLNYVVRVNGVLELALLALVFALVPSKTGVGNLHALPLAIAFVDTQLISQSSDTQHSRSACRHT